jgi:hypothetical protein
VGSRGIARLFRRLPAANPALKVHLIGRGFGDRVVTATATALDPGTTGVTLTLLQAAYSHNGSPGWTRCTTGCSGRSSPSSAS